MLNRSRRVLTRFVERTSRLAATTLPNPQTLVLGARKSSSVTSGSDAEIGAAHERWRFVRRWERLAADGMTRRARRQASS